jgi:hypothetical protein
MNGSPDSLAVISEGQVPGNGKGVPDSFWRSLQLFNAYRTAAALLLLLTAAYWGDMLQFGSRDMRLFLIGSSLYAGFGLAMFAMIRTRERFTLQLSIT